MITLYTWDDQRIFAGAVHVDPFGPVPPGTDVQPPYTTGTEVAQWAEGAWRVLEARPEPPAPPPPPPQPTLAERRAAVVTHIKALRDAKTQGGGYAVGSHWFHSDTFSRTQQIGLVMLGANIPAGLQWRTMGGAFVTMTPTLAGQVFGAAAAQDQALFAYAEGLRMAVEASAEPEAVDIASGWPSTFAGAGV